MPDVKVKVCEGQRLLETLDAVAKTVRFVEAGETTTVTEADLDRLVNAGVVEKSR